MSAPNFTPWKVGGRVGSTAREGLVGLYAIDRETPDKYQGNGVAYAHSLADARMAAAAPELYAALEACLAWMSEHGVDRQPEAFIPPCMEQARNALGKAVPRG